MTAIAVPADRRFYVFVAVISVAALSFLAWLLLFRTTEGASGLEFMPAVNASLNATSAVCLTAGWFAVRARKLKLHRNLMITALVASSLFLVCYVVYHYVHGDTKYTGEGAIRVVYFAILITHVILSMPIVPLALLALWFAFTRRYPTHTKITRVLLPMWLYVSVTGVAVYFFLR